MALLAPKAVISKDFRPERALLAKLLAFVGQGGGGSKEAIMAQTGIPTGTSSGKVEPMIKYAWGMGLITADNIDNHWQLGLTPLGRVIIEEDRFLNEPQTLWLLHLMLCRPRGDMLLLGVVDPWFALFADSLFRLGTCFQRQDFVTLLLERYSEKKSKKAQDNENCYINSVVGVVLNSYLESNSFGDITVLRRQTDDTACVERCSAPTDKSYFPLYTAYLYLLWDELFRDENQIALDRFSEESRCFTVMGWGDTAIYRWLEWMVDKDLIQLDRYTGIAMLLRLKTTAQVVGNIYSELI